LSLIITVIVRGQHVKTGNVSGLPRNGVVLSHDVCFTMWRCSSVSWCLVYHV